MSMPTQVKGFSTELLTFQLERMPEGHSYGIKQIEVKVINDETGAFSVMRFSDLPQDVSDSIREIVAMIEVHAGERFFAAKPL